MSAWLVSCALAATVAGCEGTHESTLADGSSPAAAPGNVLRGLQHPVVTRARVLTLDTARRTDFAACRRQSPETSFPTDARIVERTSRYGVSYTLRVAPRSLFGCDLRPGSRRGSLNACALAVGKLSGGRLLDPRLTLSCGFGHKRPLAFAWVTPLAATRWVVIMGGSGDEVYRTLGALPVRVAISDGVSVHDAAATIEVRELSADGKLLTQGTERVVVAG